MKFVDYLPKLVTENRNSTDAKKLYEQAKQLCKKYSFKLITSADHEKRS